MLNLILFCVLTIFLVSSLTGLIAFMKDLKQFKTEIGFSGNRKQLIEHLLFTDTESEENENDNTD